MPSVGFASIRAHSRPSCPDSCLTASPLPLRGDGSGISLTAASPEARGKLRAYGIKRERLCRENSACRCCFAFVNASGSLPDRWELPEAFERDNELLLGCRESLM